MEKEQFCKIIEFIQELRNKEHNFSKALQEFTDDTDFTGFFTHTPDFLVKWLQEVLGDNDGWLEWWTWDNDFGQGGLTVRNINETEDRELKSSSELYDWMNDVYEWQ